MMLGWVISCHDDKAQELLDRLEKKIWAAAAVSGRQLLARAEFKYAQPHDV